MEFKYDLLSSTPFDQRRTCQMMHATPSVCAHSGSLKNYFGDGSDGAVTISSSTNWETTTGEHDTGVVIKNFTSLTIDEGAVVTAAHRAKAMLVYVSGDCTINGELSMSRRGAVGTAPNLVLHSESLGSTDWSTAYGGGTTLNENAALSPAGTMTADTVNQIDNTLNGIFQTVTLARSTTFTASTHVQNIDSGRSRFWIMDETWATLSEITFNWSAGVPTTHTSTNASDITYSAVGDGWYRVSFSFTSDTASEIHRLAISPEYSVHSNHAINVWGSMINLGETLGTYEKTTDTLDGGALIYRIPASGGGSSGNPLSAFTDEKMRGGPKTKQYGAPMKGAAATEGEFVGNGISAPKGANGINGQCGSGGMGGNAPSGENYFGSQICFKGASGSGFSGGTGGGGQGISGPSQMGVSSLGSAYGGKGGDGKNGAGAYNGYGGRSGGGAGNPAGATGDGDGASYIAESGTGGVIIFLIGGNLSIGVNGIVSSDGGNGGHAAWYNTGGHHHAHGGGGGSGGGSVSILYGGILSNSGIIRANGGIGGIGNCTNGGWGVNFCGGHGGDGGDGSVIIERIKQL